MINLIIFNIETSFDGIATYEYFNNSDCSGTPSITGTTIVTNGIGSVEIENASLTEDISIKGTDSKGCTTCSGFIVENNEVCTPFNGTASFVEPETLEYYVLNGCDESYPPYSTLLVPDGIGQRYLLPIPVPRIYTWSGVISTSGSIFNGSIQRIDGEFNCPD